MDPVIRQEAGDILESERFKRCRGIIHHKGTNVARHSLEVAEGRIRGKRGPGRRHPSSHVAYLRDPAFPQSRLACAAGG